MALHLTPQGVLEFQRTPDGPFMRIVTQTMMLRNGSETDSLAFKVKTTAPKSYCVRPNGGVIGPGEEREIQVLMQPMKEEPPEAFKSKDKFLVQAVRVKHGDAYQPGTLEFWQDVEATRKSEVEEYRLKVQFVPASKTDAGKEETAAKAPSSPTKDVSSPASPTTKPAAPSSPQSAPRPASAVKSENQRQPPIAESVKMTAPSVSVPPPSTAPPASTASPTKTAEKASPDTRSAAPPAIPQPPSLLGDRRLSNPLKNEGARAEIESLKKQLDEAQAKIKTLKESCDHYQSELQSARSGVKQRKGGASGGAAMASPLGIPTSMAELHTLQATGFPFQLAMTAIIVSFLMGAILF